MLPLNRRQYNNLVSKYVEEIDEHWMDVIDVVREICQITDFKEEYEKSIKDGNRMYISPEMMETAKDPIVTDTMKFMASTRKVSSMLYMYLLEQYDEEDEEKIEN
jgi:hypothetical protein